MKKFKQFREGIASFYAVAFSTLVLVVVAASFATIVISEVMRTSNDDLAQSAYDSALAGIEDAKIAYANYQRCISKDVGLINDPPRSIDEGDGATCRNTVYWMNNGDCDMVAKMLGRYNESTADQGVFITETKDDVLGSGKGDNGMQQYYTCVMIDTKLNDYMANLTADNNVRLVKAQFDGVRAKEIKSIRLSWYLNDARETTNYNNDNGSRVTFRPAGEEARPSTPPVLSLQMVQTGESFSVGHFEQEKDRFNDGMGVNGITQDNQTDRATLFLVPTLGDFANNNDSDENRNYIGAFVDNQNLVEAAQVAATNDQTSVKLPFAVRCYGEGSEEEYLCSTVINLPDPLEGSRSDDTFMFLVTLPYGEPDTDFKIQFYKDANAGGDAVTLVNTQISIDSTGRANDLYRRVVTRLESSDAAFPYTYYAMELMGDQGDDLLKKVMIVKCENNFYDQKQGPNGIVYEGSMPPQSAFDNNPSGSYGCN